MSPSGSHINWSCDHCRRKSRCVWQTTSHVSHTSVYLGKYVCPSNENWRKPQRSDACYWLSLFIPLGDVTCEPFCLSLRFAGGHVGCGVGLECSCGSIQDPAPDGRVTDLLEYCLWSVFKVCRKITWYPGPKCTQNSDVPTCLVCSKKQQLHNFSVKLIY